MIQVPNSEPTNLGAKSVTADPIASAQIAATQVAKAVENEAKTAAAVEEANFRLTKATEMLREAQITYADAVATNSFLKEQSRLAYNNALAGFRKAEEHAATVAEEHGVAKSVAAKLATVAKAGINSAADLKAAVAAAKTDDDKTACVEAAERLKLAFFLPKGWAAQYKPVAKREVSSKERASLAAKGKAMPDGSYPINSVADLKNAISSYGRANDPAQVKAHIITQAKALGAVDQLPASWGVTNGGTVMKAVALILCPECMGEQGNSCPVCAGNPDNQITDKQFGEWMDNNPAIYTDGGSDLSKAFGFTTEALLTRDFQKSAAYQDYIFSKGGPGSGGPQILPGHEFFGNQWTGGSKHTFTRGEMKGKSEFWKQTYKRYAQSAEGHIKDAMGHRQDAEGHTAAGRHAEAEASHRKAAESLEKAAGAHKGMQALHTKVSTNGTRNQVATQVRPEVHGIPRNATSSAASAHDTAASQLRDIKAASLAAADASAARAAA